MLSLKNGKLYTMAEEYRYTITNYGAFSFVRKEIGALEELW